MGKNRNKSILIVALLLIVAFGLLGFGNLINLSGNTSSSGSGGDSTRDYVLNTCTLDMFTRFHIHPHLTIFINGENYTIPANIGITLTCLHPIHTHDNSGTIHVESAVPRNFTLGDFFAVWGQPFSKEQILNYKADANHEITMTVDGQQSSEYQNLVLKDKQQIVIEYKEIKK